MTDAVVNGVRLGMYPDEGDAGGTKTYLSALNRALASAVRTHAPGAAVPVVTTVGWYAQTYPGEVFSGFQLLPLVQDLKQCVAQGAPPLTYEVSVMPFQSWSGYSAEDPRKAREVAAVMQRVLDESRLPTGAFCIDELRLRFGHEVNYYIKSGLYPPPLLDPVHDPGAEFRQAFAQVAHACRALPPEYARRIKLFYCPNIATLPEYEAFLPPLECVDYIGIDYYCPVRGCLSDVPDLLRKLKPLHDKYSDPARRPFIIGETGLHFDDPPHDAQHRLQWLALLTSPKVRAQLPNLVGVNWFNYQKDRDYRILRPEADANEALVRLLCPTRGGVRKMWHTLVGKP